MLATLEAKVLAAALGLVLLGVGALGVYAAVEHDKAQRATIDTLTTENRQEKANTATALQAASAVVAALGAKAAAQQAAVKNLQDAQTRINAAAAASPSVASQVVPEAMWEAVYGPTNAK